MKPKKMNVQDIAEVLLDELDKMEKTARTIHRAVEESKKVLPAISNQLTRVEQTRLQIDREPLQAFLSEFKRISKERAVLPGWSAIWLVVVHLVAVVAIYFAFVGSGQVDELSDELTEELGSLKNTVSVHQEYLQDTEQQERFQEWIEDQ
jgi:predicted  nucleic acid-binding Zn-ribbon protein